MYREKKFLPYSFFKLASSNIEAQIIHFYFYCSSTDLGKWTH